MTWTAQTEGESGTSRGRQKTTSKGLQASLRRRKTMEKNRRLTPTWMEETQMARPCLKVQPPELPTSGGMRTPPIQMAPQQTRGVKDQGLKGCQAARVGTGPRGTEMEMKKKRPGQLRTVRWTRTVAPTQTRQKIATCMSGGHEEWH